MLLRFAKHTLSLAVISFLLVACGNDGGGSADPTSQAQDSTAQSGPLLETSPEQQAAAQQNSAKAIAPSDLLKSIKSDTTAAVTVVNFWKTDCLKCLQMQQALQKAKAGPGGNKLRLLAVNLDGADMTNGVNMVLKKAGITSEVLQIQGTDTAWLNEVSGGWQGNVPALFIRAKDGGKQFYPREFSAEELTKLLEPILK